MYLEVHPEGPLLTSAQAKKLDDEFFRSDPRSYYSSRIAGLLRDADVDGAPTLSRSEQPGFFKALGIQADELSAGKPEIRDMQVAVDALALRHQCAEALSRFVYAVSTATPRQGDAPCTWLAVSDSPTSTADVITKSLASFKADDELWARLVLPLEARGDARARSAADTALEWVEHAEYLLTDDELSVNVGHNKFKHGLAVSSRNDVRVELVTEAPNEKGEVPLSAFGEGKSLPLFDRPLFTFLSRPRGKPPRGIEAISLRVDVPTVLAETWMMANVYAALFHVAALKHFALDAPEDLAPFPTLVINRPPKRVVASNPLGFRAPVTDPADNSVAARPAGVVFYDGFMPVAVDYGSKTGGVVVDD
jgi:hypothetical protein